MFIHFSQSNGLWRSDWFFTEPNNPNPAQSQSRSFQRAYVNAIKSPQNVRMIQFFSTADDNWIEFPQSGCPFPVSMWRVAKAAGGIQTHSRVYLTPILHLVQSLKPFNKKNI